MKITILLVILCYLSTPGSSFSGVAYLQTGLDLIKVAKETVIGLSKVWGIIDGQYETSIPLPLIDKTERKMFNRLNVINSKLDMLAASIDSVGTQTIASLLHAVPEHMRLELRLNDLYDYMTRVDVIYSRMQDYVKSTHKYERLTLEDFAKSIVSHESGSVTNLMERIHTFISPQGEGVVKTGVLNLLLRSFQEVSDMMCSNQQSPQQILYTLYNSISLTELKGYSMVQFSYMLLKLYNKGNFTKEAAQMRSKYEDRTNKAIDTVKQAMKHASREYWKCDPRKHIKGETYEEVTQLLQGYVQNEVDMNPTQTCGENCAEYQYAKSYGCFKNQFCKKQRNCNGKILNCRFVDSDMQICTANPNSGRRYESIEYENGLVYGRKQSCPRGQTKVDSWWRWLFWHCSYCMCLCDEQGPFSDRYINMRAVVADVANNKVVTGLRFVKQNRIIHLQIQEGLLLPFGTIDPDSVHWVPAEDYRIEDYKIYSGQDYHILTWEKRAMDLDDLIADKDHVVTGVRFKEIGSHLNFEIYITPFNFSTGKLHDPLSKSYWKDNPNTDISYPHPRTKVNIYTPDIPTRSPNPSKPLSKSDQYIEFSHTDFERDAAQTTIPFLDAQRLQSIKPVPLSGAGIFYKGNRNFGGFIVPKVITYDFTEHLQPAFPEDLHTLEPTLQTVVEVEPESN